MRPRPSAASPKSTTFPSRLRQRRQLAPAQIAGLLEERLYDPRLSLAEVVAGCRRAADAQLAAVACQPSRVALAAHALAGSAVRVAVAPAADLPAAEDTSRRHVLAATDRVLQDGASVIGLMASPNRLEGPSRQALAAEIRAVADLAAGAGGVVRVILPTSEMDPDQIVTGCRVSIDAGAAMVQGGTWSGQDRTSLAQIGLMRRALGDDPLLKWTAPIGSLDRLLLACAEGVDRFNADTTTILKQAAERARVAELRIPEAGLDY